LKDRSHGVLITTLQLISDIVEVCPEQKQEFVKIVPTLVRLLRNFISMGFSPEHDVGGITDPFMQVKLLHLLRQLGEGSAEAAEQMTDVLTQVATNTESAKNVGNSILYECVKTIMGVSSDSGLKTVAINILGRFLLNRDNNIRYVALQTLTKVIHDDNAAVQRHRNTIVDCLKDPDVSIRQRALDLVYQLVNAQNVEILTAELLNYLVVCHTEHKANLVSHIMAIVEKYSPSLKWRLNTIVTMLTMAGKECNENIISNCILFISQAESQHRQVIHHIYRNMLDDTSQTGYLQVGIWCIGEYGSLLLQGCPRPSNDADVLFSNTPSSGFSSVLESEVVSTLCKFFKLHNADVATKSLILNALLKLTAHVSFAAKETIQAALAPFRQSMNLELQQRSSEYDVLLGRGDWDALRGEILAKMPVVDEATWRRKKESAGANSPSAGAKDAFGLDDSVDLLAGDVGVVSSGSSAIKMPSVPIPSSASSSGLLDIFGSGPVASAVPVKAGSTSIFDDMSALSLGAPAAPKANTIVDIFGGGVISPLPPTAPSATPATANSAILDLFGGASLAPTPAAPIAAPSSNLMGDLMGLSMSAPSPSLAAAPMSPIAAYAPAASAMSGEVVVPGYDKGGMQISLHCTKPNPSNLAETKIVCKFSNTSNAAFSSLLFQVCLLLINFPI
jgi:AP-1 complex subunit gamma-1